MFLESAKLPKALSKLYLERVLVALAIKANKNPKIKDKPIAHIIYLLFLLFYKLTTSSYLMGKNLPVSPLIIRSRFQLHSVLLKRESVFGHSNITVNSSSFYVLKWRAKNVLFCILKEVLGEWRIKINKRWDFGKCT